MYQRQVLTYSMWVIAVSYTHLDVYKRQDQVIWMEDGKAVVGTHEEILEKIPEYRSPVSYTHLLLLIGAEDDVLWDTAKYIRRMKQRVIDHPHTCRLAFVIYEHGTHFVFPESMLRTMLPVGSGLFMKLAFKAARKYPKECLGTRQDIDHRVRNAVAEWMEEVKKSSGR